MTSKRTITIEVDQNQMFDMVAATGDSGADIGHRLAGFLLGDVSAITQIGLGAYGIVVLSSQDKPA